MGLLASGLLWPGSEMGPSWEPLSPTLFLGHREPCLQPEGAGVRPQQQQGQEPRREGAQKADPRPRCSEDRSTPALTAPTLAIGETLIVGSPCACQFLEGRNCSVRFCSFRRTSAHCLEGVRNVFDESMNKGFTDRRLCWVLSSGATLSQVRSVTGLYR